jgi:glutamyl-Q tRNA(Asp) synthetase
VLARRDAPVSYALAATVDDAASGGDPCRAWVGPGARDRRPAAAPGAARLPTRQYHHHPLLADATAGAWPSARARPASPICAPAGPIRATCWTALRAGRFPIVAEAPAS